MLVFGKCGFVAPEAASRGVATAMCEHSQREAVAMGLYPKLGWFGRPSAEDRSRVARAMERLKVTDLADRHLDELSGGQRQRVFVAQGMAQPHEALLLDEPLTGLDILSARTIDEIIHTERDRGHAVVLTTHDLDEARAADWVILMSGHVVAYGPPAEVLTRHLRQLLAHHNEVIARIG